MRRHLLPLLLAACAPAAPTPLPPAPSAAPAASAALGGARWRFADAPEAAAAVPFPRDDDAGARGPRASRDTLAVGRGGRRWLMQASKPTLHAEALVGVPLVDVRADGAGALFLGADGSVHAAAEPLGPTTRRGGPPPAAGARFRFGVKSVLGVTPDGALLRSTDGGASWTRGSIGARAGEQLVALESDRRGHFVVLLAPQRLLVSSDDGATFARLPLPGDGARVDLFRDGASEPWLTTIKPLTDSSESERIVLGGGTPTLVPGEPAPFESARLGADHWIATGEAIVRLTREREPTQVWTRAEVELRGGKVVPLGRLLPAWEPTRIEAVAHEGRVTLLVRENQDTRLLDVSADEPPRVTKLARAQATATLLAAGPSGWLLAKGLCVEGHCGAIVRQAGRWRALSSPADVGAAAVDGSRAYLWDRTTTRLFGMALDGVDPVDLGVQLPALGSLTTGPDGAVRAFLPYPSRVVRVAGGRADAPLYLPAGVVRVGLAGARGYADGTDTRGLPVAYETGDGGAHWTSVAAAVVHGELRCGALGCSAGPAVRVGWDLPGQAAASVAALAEAPRPPVVARARVPAATLACAHGEPWKALPAGSLASGLGLAGDVRWVSTGAALDAAGKPAGEASLVVRGGAAPVVAPIPIPGEHPLARHALGDAGLARVELSHGPKQGGAYAPVSADFAWVDAAAGRSGRRKVPLGPIRVSHSQFTGLFQVVDGGAVLLPMSYGGGRILGFDGKDRAFQQPPSPHDHLYDQAIVAGGRLVIGVSLSSVMLLARSDDLGKTWKAATWFTGSPGVLSVVDGEAVLVVEPESPGEPPLVLPIGPLGGDLPDWTRSARPGLLDACDPKARSGARFEDRLDGELTVRLKGAAGERTLGAGVQVTRGLRGGKRCTAVLTATDGEHTALLAPHDLAHGHLFRKGPGARLEWTTLSCAEP